MLPRLCSTYYVASNGRRYPDRCGQVRRDLLPETARVGVGWRFPEAALEYKLHWAEVQSLHFGWHIDVGCCIVQVLPLSTCGPFAREDRNVYGPYMTCPYSFYGICPGSRTAHVPMPAGEGAGQAHLRCLSAARASNCRLHHDTRRRRCAKHRLYPLCHRGGQRFMLRRHSGHRGVLQLGPRDRPPAGWLRKLLPAQHFRGSSQIWQPAGYRSPRDPARCVCGSARPAGEALHKGFPLLHIASMAEVGVLFVCPRGRGGGGFLHKGIADRPMCGCQVSS